jgi:hypothetical protein
MKVPLHRRTDFYPSINKEPSKYIELQPELNKMLDILKNTGKKLFVTTNASIWYLELTMTATLGKDWKQYFDLCLAECNKPLF